MYITITGASHFLGIEALKPGKKVLLVKDKDNEYDEESIRVQSDTGATFGYVANSTSTVAKGTHSAGYIYNSFKDEAEATILFVVKGVALAEVKTK